MGFFQQQTQVVQIDDENSVTIRRLTFGESQAVISESTKFDIVEKDAVFSFERNQAERMKRAVVSWEGPGFEGREVTEENLMALPTEIGQKIADAIAELNKGLSGEEQKNLPAPTSA